MKRVALAIVSTITGLVLLLSFKTHSVAAPISSPQAVASAPATGTAAKSSGSSNGKAAGTAHSTNTTSSASKTYTGQAVMTQYGPVQVRITVRNGSVVSATAVEYPLGNPRDAEINAYAIPALNQEAASAGTANINMVSGATYTSQGCLSSLQSALDAAGL